MAVAADDPLRALANPNATDFCLRCPTPTGWLGGRSDPTNGTALSLSSGDFKGVSCTACHHMLDSFPALNLEPALYPETDPAKFTAAATTRNTGISSSPIPACSTTPSSTRSPRCRGITGR